MLTYQRSSHFGPFVFKLVDSVKLIYV